MSHITEYMSKSVEATNHADLAERIQSAIKYYGTNPTGWTVHSFQIGTVPRSGALCAVILFHRPKTNWE